MKKKKQKPILLFFLLTTLCSFAQEQKHSIDVSGNKTSVAILTSGPIKFYKATNGNTHYIENVKLQSGIVELKNLGESRSLNSNRGKLLVIFKDCVQTRSKAAKSDMREARVLQLIDEYNNCTEYTKDFELSEREKIDQSYSTQKSVLNYDVGIGYHNQTTNFRVNSANEQSESNSSLSIYASLNISPSHLGSLTGKLFYDFALQYNLGTSFEFANIDKNLSSLLITLTPKYYFSKPKSNFNPFIGAGFGAVILDYEITDTTGILFDTIDSSRTKFIYGLELGTEFLNNFEFTFNYYPNYTTNISVDDETVLRSKFQNLTFKLGYKF
jgi:opacity protein-like surface antigen